MRIVITGPDDVFAAAAAIEAFAAKRGLAVVRDDRPIPDIDYSLEDLLCLRRSDVDLPLAGDDPAWTVWLADLRARFPDVTLTVE